MSSYPIAEVFRSPQGEARWAGYYFTFVRFAGCNVGRPYSAAEQEEINSWNPGNREKALSIYQEKCQTQLGQFFPCDTNYGISQKMTVEEIVKACDGVERACLTGGEPLLHDLLPLLEALDKAGIKAHLETSGTKKIPFGVSKNRHRDLLAWITVSPKVFCLSESLEVADELKILVGPNFNEEEFVKLYSAFFKKVWLQPINYEHTINMENMKHCIELQKKYPLCKLSSQNHKVWCVR